MDDNKKTVGFRITEPNRSKILFLKRYFKTLGGDISDVSNSDIVNFAIEQLFADIDRLEDQQSKKIKKKAGLDLDLYREMTSRTF